MQPTMAWRHTFTRWLEELLAAISSVSVSTKILGMVLALTIALGLGVTLQVRTVMTETLLAELDTTGEALTRDLAMRSAALLVAGDLDALTTLLTETVRHHADTRYAFVVNDQGEVVAHTFADQVPADLLALIPPQVPYPPAHLHYETYAGPLHDFAQPVGPAATALVRLGLSERRLQQIIDSTTRRMLWTTGYVAGVGVLAAMLLTWLITRPILDLVTTTNRVRQGDLTARAPHWTDDEIGTLANAFNGMIGELETSQQAVQEKEAARSHLLSQLIEAQEEERKRIARDLHDEVGQALTSALVGIKVLEQSAPGVESQAKIEALRQVLNETLTRVRLLSRQLRPSALDDLGLAAALERYISEFTSRYPTLTVDLHCNVPNRLSTTVGISLYRIIQEAMTNAARHSGASTLSVLVTQREGRIQAIIEDNGHGFDVEQVRRAGSSVGLHSMSERSALAGGKLDMESNEDGTTVYVEMPLETTL